MRTIKEHDSGADISVDLADCDRLYNEKGRLNLNIRGTLSGAGGQAIGLEKADFTHTALVEIDRHCCNTLRHNRPEWNILEEDMRMFKERAANYKGMDLLAGGLPCPPFSVAGKQLGELDEQKLFNDAIDIVDAARPRAVMIENVRGFLDAVFHDYRERLKAQLDKLGYRSVDCH